MTLWVAASNFTLESFASDKNFDTALVAFISLPSPASGKKYDLIVPDVVGQLIWKIASSVPSTITKLSSSSYLKLDRYSYLINFISIKDGQIEIKDNLYFYLYRSGYHVFSENKIFGVGTKNYRKYSEKRSKELRNTEDKNKFIIDTHPHQIYLEFLSEHGLFGTITVLSLFIFVFFKMLKIIILNRNNIQIACFCYLVSIFLPLIPSGSFFTDFNSTLFWINFSIFFAVSKESNIFKLK